MKRKFGILLTIFLIIFCLTACGKNYAEEFKQDYEDINGKENAKGKIHRVVTIPSDNPFEEVSPSEIIKMIENKETFYVYFGSRLCPWCRSTIEKSISMAKRHGIKKIYYVDIWDDEGNEILRDKYKLDENGKTILEQEGNLEYQKLLEYFKDYLKDYTLTDNNGNKVETGEKRIYAPNYMYIEKGIIKRLVTGISDKQKDSREELTKEILKDEEKIFEEFFAEVCDEAC